jgi:glutathione peroxidase
VVRGLKTTVMAFAAGMAVTAAGTAGASACPALLDRTLPDLTDRPQSLCQYAGKVVLIVNTASQCGYTPQYEGLERLYRTYAARGLVVLGFPANDFGGQEPGSNKDIASFCEINYGVSFPMFAKTTVAGAGANPLFARLAEASGSAPRWNFHKYLVDRSGQRVVAFPSRVTPDDRQLVGEIERLLAAR